MTLAEPQPGDAPSLVFDKYEGLGNDFVLVEADAALPSSELAARLCDRHFGIGADGVLVVVPPDSSEARARMIVLNADGTRPEMCGNGLRCVALHLARSDGVSRGRYVIETDAGALACSVDRDGDRASVRAITGRAKLEAPLELEAEGRQYRFERVSLGNPHAVCLDASDDPETIDRVAPGVSAKIAGGSNVEFVRQLGPRRFGLVVWERGVGRTLACGTGAAATAVVLARGGRSDFGAPMEIRLPGGPLSAEVRRDGLEVTLTGPARRVFGGRLTTDFAASTKSAK